VLLTRALVIHYAMTCGHVDPDIAAMMAVTAWKESRFETTTISPPNRDGTRDFGPYQINSKNLRPLGLTERTALDPCEASRAAATWFKILSVYNTGNERTGILNGYAGDTYAQRHGSVSPVPAPAPPMNEPVQAAKGAQQILVFDGWSK
jgi:hypothetical protein